MCAVLQVELTPPANVNGTKMRANIAISSVSKALYVKVMNTYHENDPDDIQLPEEADCKLLEPIVFKGGLVLRKVSVLLGTVGSNVESRDKGKSHDRIDDRPHTNAPPPASNFEDR